MRIHQIAVTVRDVNRAVGFYRDSLGLTFLFRAPPGLMLSLPEGTAPAGNSIIYFGVDDIRATHTALVARGVGFVGEPHLIARLPDRDVWLSEFRDSEGNVLALMSEVPRSA
jgi:methylmalonyl-CoA/ethylmalonyl-CoA epimerase